jgi:hypothetical protein
MIKQNALKIAIRRSITIFGRRNIIVALLLQFAWFILHLLLRFMLRLFFLFLFFDLFPPRYFLRPVNLVLGEWCKGFLGVMFILAIFSTLVLGHL